MVFLVRFRPFFKNNIFTLKLLKHSYINGLIFFSFFGLFLFWLLLHRQNKQLGVQCCDKCKWYWSGNDALKCFSPDEKGCPPYIYVLSSQTVLYILHYLHSNPIEMSTTHFLENLIACLRHLYSLEQNFRAEKEAFWRQKKRRRTKENHKNKMKDKKKEKKEDTYTFCSTRTTDTQLDGSSFNSFLSQFLLPPLFLFFSSLHPFVGFHIVFSSSCIRLLLFLLAVLLGHDTLRIT